MAGKDNPKTPLSSDYGIASLLEHWKQQARQTVVKVADTVDVRDQVIRPESVQVFRTVVPPELLSAPEILLQATILNLGDQTAEGQLVKGVTIPWFEIIEQLEKDPEFLLKVSPRKFEELIAGAYERSGFPDVILTPRSGDGGRDVIATKPGIGSIRIMDQAKRYKPGHKVSADEVRSVLGALTANPNISKAVITTTSQFAPGIDKNKELKAFIPYRLELMNGQRLIQWLLDLKRR